MTDEELNDYVENLIKTYKGDIVDLTHAIGALKVGKIYGWRVLRITISSPSYTKYQRILGLEFKKVLPEKTEFSTKSAGYNLVMKVGKFWETVRGQFSIDPKEKILIV